MSKLHLYHSDNAFARNVFKMHGMAPVDMLIDSNRAPAQRTALNRYRYEAALNEHDLGRIAGAAKDDRIELTYSDKTEDEYLSEVFTLRNQVFAEMLKWQVVSLSGMEVDRYDLMNPWYITIENSQKKVVGTWRAMPSSGPYMLRDIFPELARGEEIPNDPSIWEISRFGVEQMAKANGGLNEDDCVAALTLDLLNTFQIFARKKNVSALVAVTSCAAERILKKLGFQVRRMGDGKAMKVGKVWCTAIWIDCADLHRRIEAKS